MSGPAVPWNAAWSAEMDQYEIRRCRFAGNQLAIWQPHKPGEGKPRFAEPHIVRQRRSIAEMRCTVCGERTPADDRWWFQHGIHHAGWFMTTEAPVHRTCADHSQQICPHLRKMGAVPRPFPLGASVMAATVKPESLAQLFNLDTTAVVVGQLKLAWPSDSIVRLPRAAL